MIGRPWQQVMLNTLNNAIKFTEKGEIMIRLYLGRPGEAARLASRAGAIREARGRGIERERGREQAAAEVAGTKRADRVSREVGTDGLLRETLLRV